MKYLKILMLIFLFIFTVIFQIFPGVYYSFAFLNKKKDAKFKKITRKWKHSMH